uniref:Ig-like domain-containing protein n=1 Tax=Stegastes partitus TaxID=144197 RepID=A0A3B4Z4G1_9TELE
MTTQVLITLVASALWIQGTNWSFASQSAEMNCSHKKDFSYNQMYWYRQRPGETMRLIVYTAAGGQPDYGGVSQTKYTASKEKYDYGALTVKDLQPEDSGVYFCAVGKHSDMRSTSSCTKTTCQ